MPTTYINTPTEPSTKLCVCVLAHLPSTKPHREYSGEWRTRSPDSSVNNEWTCSGFGHPFPFWFIQSHWQWFSNFRSLGSRFVLCVHCLWFKEASLGRGRRGDFQPVWLSWYFAAESRKRAELSSQHQEEYEWGFSLCLPMNQWACLVWTRWGWWFANRIYFWYCVHSH